MLLIAPPQQLPTSKHHQHHASSTLADRSLCMAGIPERRGNSNSNNRSNIGGGGMGLNLNEDNTNHRLRSNSSGNANNNNASLRSFGMMEDHSQSGGMETSFNKRRDQSYNSNNSMLSDNPKNSKRSKMAASDYQGTSQIGLAQLPSNNNNGQQGNLFVSTWCYYSYACIGALMFFCEKH